MLGAEFDVKFDSQVDNSVQNVFCSTTGREKLAKHSFPLVIMVHYKFCCTRGRQYKLRIQDCFSVNTFMMALHIAHNFCRERIRK